jgi:antitoxin component YwqK of YwqJK toxin-antitoxin module
MQLSCCFILIFLLSGAVFAFDLLTYTEEYDDCGLKHKYYYYLDDNGQKVLHGSYTWFNESGDKTHEAFNSHGIRKSWTDWEYDYDSGLLTKQTEAVKQNDTTYFTVTEWGYYPTYDHITGRIQYKNGTDYDHHHGPEIYYHPNGLPSQQQDWQDGQRHGYFRHWDDEGILTDESQSQKGLSHGTAKKWYKGQLYHLQEWAYGQKHGISKTWYFGLVFPGHLPGQLDISGQYSNGAQCGTWLDWNGYQFDATFHGLCERLEIVEPNPYPEIDPDDPLAQKEVRGRVTDRETGSPIANAVISAKGEASTTSDSNGLYSFTLPAGDTYKISVSKEGYYSRSGTANLKNAQYKRMNAALKKVAARPAITAVESRYGKFFIEGVPLTNEYKVLVDWNGETPGVVKFAVNGKVSEVVAAGNEITKSFNMGTEFKAGLQYLTNNLQIMAVSKPGTRSQTERLHPIVIPLPAWSTAMGKFGDLKFEDNLITYNLKKTWPEKPVEIQINPDTLGSLWNIWSLFPLVGGKNLGIPPTQVFLDIEAKTDGSGSVTSGGTTGFQAAGQELQGKLGGKGKLQYEPGKGLEWKGSSLILGVEGTLKKEVGPITLIPALEGAVNLGFGVGRVIKWFNSLARIEGKITTGYEIDLEMINSKGEIGFQKSEGTISNGIGLGLSMGASKLKAELSGGGTNKAYWQFPANPGYMKKIESELSAKMAMAIWLFSKDFTASHKFVYPGDTAPTSLTARSILSLADFQPISRNFLLHEPYSQFVEISSGSRSTMDFRVPSGQIGDPAELIKNVYPYSEPVVATHEGHTAIAFVYFDPADPTLQATEIYFSYDNGTGFSIPGPIINDTQAEFAPTLGFDAQGNLICVWEKIKDPNFVGTEIDDMAKAMEIVYAVYDVESKTWSSPTPLTDNDYLDHSPLLKTGADGSLMLIWQSNAANDMIGDAVNPTSVHYAFWNLDRACRCPSGSA